MPENFMTGKGVPVDRHTGSSPHRLLTPDQF